jgi:alpha-ketoglutarate-dependent taurine dioxygenase
MSLTTTDLTALIGSELKADKKTLLSGGAVAQKIRHVLEQRGVVIARGVAFEDAEQVAFAKTLGTVRLGTVKSEGVDGILKVTFDKDQNPAYAAYFKGTFYWHMDGTYDAVPPLATVLTPQVLSASGGQTEFANTYAAYDALPEDEKKYLETLKVVHTVWASHRIYDPNPSAELMAYWNSFPTREHPLVWTHKTGRKSLVLGASCDYVVGMAQKDSEALLNRLITWTTQPQFVYQHKWQLGDMVMWDNTGTMHRVLPYATDSGRRLHRVTLEGEESVAEAA